MLGSSSTTSRNGSPPAGAAADGLDCTAPDTILLRLPAGTNEAGPGGFRDGRTSSAGRTRPNIVRQTLARAGYVK
ncbi:hypothetical protein GCM10010195_29170 [Kitasatospora griseola]|nr:hypothetical protein GCM10010195_29170 [Kitasatospora griseola]